MCQNNVIFTGFFCGCWINRLQTKSPTKQYIVNPLEKSPTNQLYSVCLYFAPTYHRHNIALKVVCNTNNVPCFDVFQVELTQIERFNTIKGNNNCVTNILNRFLLMYNKCKIQTLCNCFVGDLVCRRFIHNPFN